MSRPIIRVYAYALALAAAAFFLVLRSATAQGAPSPSLFAPEPVGSVSTPHTVTVPLHAAGKAASIAVAGGTDEFQILPGGTCAAEQTYAAGDTCTVAVTFAPTSAGAAAGAVLLRAADGHTLGAARMHGTGLGAAVAFNPGLLQTLAARARSPQGFAALTSTATDEVYLVDASTRQLLRLDSQTGSTAASAATLPATGPITMMAADVDGTLFVAQASGVVSRVDTATGALTDVDLSSIPNDTSAGLTAMAVDREGRLLLAFGTRVLRSENGTWTAIAGSAACADATASCGDGGDVAHAQFNAIRAMAVDAAGNLLLADEAQFRIRRVDPTLGSVTTVAGTGAACTHGTCGDNGPATAAALGKVSGLAVDPFGDTYLSEQGRGMRRIDAATGVIAPVLPSAETRFRAGAVQLAALRDGSVILLAEADPATVARFTAGTAALNFAQTAVGQTSTDSVQTVNVSNLGNAPLTLATPAAGTNPSTTSDFPLSSTQTCPQLSSSSASQSLAPGDSCSLQVKFTPTVAGNVSAKVVLTEAAAPAQVAHSVAVQGVAAAPTAQASIALTSLPTSLVYGQPLTLVATVSSTASSNPAPTGSVTFSEGTTVIAANVALSSGAALAVVTLPSTGNHTYSVSYSGDSNYAASAQNTNLTIAVGRAASVFTISLPTYQYLQVIRADFVLSGQYSGTGIALPTAPVNYSVLDSRGTVLVTGTSNYAYRVNSIDENAPIGRLDPGTYTFRLSYSGDQNFLPLQKDYALVVQPARPNITFAPIAGPVTFGTPPIALSAIGNVNVPPVTPTGLPITFSVLSGPGSIVNGQLVVTGVGTIAVAANEAASTYYAAAPQVTQTVVSMAPAVKLTWATPASIVSGTPLSGTQLNASAVDSNGQPVAGTYTYTPPAGTVLPAGNTTLNVSFTPTDTAHYGVTPLTASVIQTVRDLNTPSITFAGGTVAYGTGLATVLNATAAYNGTAVPGTFVYTTGSTTLTGTTTLPVGTYTVVATFTPTDASTYHGGSGTATVTVGKSAPAMTAASSASPALLNSTVKLTATVSGGSVVPTGTVQFAAGTTVLDSAPVDGSGTASVSLNTLPAGSQTITAVYSGDNAYSGTSATFTEVVGDFTLALAANAASTQSVPLGKVATYQFTVAPTFTAALIGDVTFTLSGLPAGATYTVTPSTVPTGSGTTNVTLAVTAPAALKAQIERQTEHSPWHPKSALVAAALLLLPFASRLRRGSAAVHRAGVLAAVIFASALLLSAGGCGTGVGYFDQAQSQQATYPLTLSAASGSLRHTATVTLEVQ